MKYFKDEQNNLFGLLDDGSQDDSIQGNWISTTPEEVNTILLSRVEATTPEQQRLNMPALTRVQFVTVLRKHNLWAQAQNLADTLSIEAQVQFYEGQVFKRMDDTLNMMAGKLALSDDQVDALFNEGYNY